MKIINLFICLLFSLSAIGEERVISLGDNIYLKMVEKPFAESEFSIKIDSEFRINGKFPFGVDVGLPTNYLSKATLIVNEQIYDLDTSNMYETKGRPFMYGECHEGWCIIRALFSEGGGWYAVEWRIRNYHPIRTVITDELDVIKLFNEYIKSKKM